MLRRRVPSRGIAAVLLVLAAAAPASAQEPDGEDEDPSAADGAADGDADDGIPGPGPEDYGSVNAPTTRWGVGPRLRYVFVPRGLIELFLEEVPSGMGHGGFGLEVTRRKGDFELVLGLEYENLSPEDGFYREKGGGDDAANVSAKTDFTEFDGFGWFTIDATFVFHRELAPKFALRYGAGFGLGILTGEVLQTDSICSGPDIQAQCSENPNGAQVNDPADLPPVFPVVNLLIGGQYRVNDQISINLEAGLRTVFFAGLSGAYYF